MLSESPCLKCNRTRPCDPAKINKLSRTNACGPYAHYLGQQEGQSERDALRAEVEVLRRALKWTARRADELAAYRPGDSCPLEPAERPDLKSVLKAKPRRLTMDDYATFSEDTKAKLDHYPGAVTGLEKVLPATLPAWARKAIEGGA